MKRIIVGISGASGVQLGKRFISHLPSSYEPYVILSKHAKVVFSKEMNVQILDNKDIGAISASGSFKNEGMVVIPCSMNTLGKISCGISDNLITRSAAVAMKEKRKLLLAPRELPFDTISLKNMLKLSKLGVIIAPPVGGYYANINSLEMMEDFWIGKWFDLFGIEHQLYKRWEG